MSGDQMRNELRHLRTLAKQTTDAAAVAPIQDFIEEGCERDIARSPAQVCNDTVRGCLFPRGRGKDPARKLGLAGLGSRKTSRMHYGISRNIDHAIRTAEIAVTELFAVNQALRGIPVPRAARQVDDTRPKIIWRS